MALVFMYGPDALQGKMFDRIGPTTFIGPAVLNNHKLVFNKPNMKDKDEGLPNIEEERGSEVFGTVFDLDKKVLDRLDGFFGGYGRKSKRVGLTLDGEIIKRDAETYIARRTGRNLTPSEASLAAAQSAMEENGADPRFIEALAEFGGDMAGGSELIILFNKGVSESDAKSIVSGVGGAVRRRMRWDKDDEVMLLVKVKDEGVGDRIRQSGKVSSIEVNAGGFRPMS